MDYNRVAIFVRVVKAGSFTAAGAEIGLPKSSLSRSVSRLEQDLGVRLLHRTTRKLALTAVGQAYYDAVSGSLTALDEADAAAREQDAQPRGVVRLSAAPDMVALAGMLAEFQRLYPRIQIDVTLTPRYVDLLTEGFDLAIRAGKLMDSSLVARRVGATEMLLVASPAYLRRAGRPKTVADLGAHDFVLYRGTDGKAVLSLTSDTGEEAHVEVNGAMVADDLNFVRAAMLAGAGIALLPVTALGEVTAADALELVLPAWRYGEASLFVILPTARFVPVRVALLRDFLVDRLTRDLTVAHGACEKEKEQRRRGAAPAKPRRERARVH
jgi:DNA-binding transcriptional LysR family regulator